MQVAALPPSQRDADTWRPLAQRAQGLLAAAAALHLLAAVLAIVAAVIPWWAISYNYDCTVSCRRAKGGHRRYVRPCAGLE